MRIFMAGTWANDDGETREVTTNQEASDALQDGFGVVSGKVTRTAEAEPSDMTD